MKVKIIKCDNEEDINYQIKRQGEDGGELMNIQRIDEIIGHVWINYIKNPHANYSDVNFTRTFYECIFKYS